MLPASLQPKSFAEVPGPAPEASVVVSRRRRQRRQTARSRTSCSARRNSAKRRSRQSSTRTSRLATAWSSSGCRLSSKAKVGRQTTRKRFRGQELENIFLLKNLGKRDSGCDAAILQPACQFVSICVNSRRPLPPSLLLLVLLLLLLKTSHHLTEISKYKCVKEEVEDPRRYPQQAISSSSSSATQHHVILRQFPITFPAAVVFASVAQQQ